MASGGVTKSNGKRVVLNKVALAVASSAALSANANTGPSSEPSSGGAQGPKPSSNNLPPPQPTPRPYQQHHHAQNHVPAPPAPVPGPSGGVQQGGQQQVDANSSPGMPATPSTTTSGGSGTVPISPPRPQTPASPPSREAALLLMWLGYLGAALVIANRNDTRSLIVSLMAVLSDRSNSAVADMIVRMTQSEDKLAQLSVLYTSVLPSLPELDPPHSWGNAYAKLHRILSELLEAARTNPEGFLKCPVGQALEGKFPR